MNDYRADEYQHEAQMTANHDLTQEQKLLNGVMGLCGESGECIDILKKHMGQGEPMNHEHLKEELGDVMWYAAEICEAEGWQMSDVMMGNVAKLKKRYNGHFTTEKSVNRVV